MRILVTVTAAAPDGERSLRACDEAAIGTALGLAGSDDEVVTATVGPVAAEPAIRRALAKGPDCAVRVWDDRLDGNDDPQVTARVLAGVADDVEPSLVVAGTRSGTDGSGATGVTLAAELDYGWVTGVTDATLDRESGVVTARRALSGRLTELVEVELPAVLTTPAGSTGPRYAGLAAVRAAHRDDIDVRSLPDLPPTATESRLSRLDATERDDVTVFEGSPASRLAAVLRANGVGP